MNCRRIRVLVLSSVDHPQIRLEAEYLGNICKVDYVTLPDLHRLSLFYTFSCFFKWLGHILLALLSLRIPPVPLRLFLYQLLLTGVILCNNELRSKRYDVIYAHWLFPAGFVGLILSRIYHSKVVSAMWGYDIQVIKGVRNYGIGGSRRVMSRFVIERSDVVIANHMVHKVMAESLVKRVSNKIVHIPPGLPDISSDVVENPSDLVDIVRSLTGKKVVLYAPHLRPLYGIMEFIKAIPLVSHVVEDVVFIIVGEGELKDEAVKLVRESGFEKNVLFLGRVNHDIMKLLYQMASVVCDLAYPGTGTTTLEAFCFGKPVIGIRSPKSVVQHGINGFLVERGDYCTLADYIIKILNDVNLRETLSKNARKIYEEKYSIEKRVMRICTLFLRLLTDND